ncbi:MAG: penicillin-insensitive murein endopeptidase [Oligoflexia bacterium]|nr:penicillin-insensitive murein endopeptidase [Oligoflexia bacterium]
MARLSLHDSGQGSQTYAYSEQAEGFYSDGRLTDPDVFPLEGEGFLKIFRPRDRGWTTRGLLEVITGAAAEIFRAYPDGERLQIGDVSAHAGGPLPEHASHQNGLDVDLAYYRMNRQEQAPELTSGFAEQFVGKGGRVSRNFDLERNHALVRALVATGRINRIFVDAALKKAFCEFSRAGGNLERDEEALRRLRPWPKHGDHLHVRILCPPNSVKCLAQDEPPPGAGCEL